MGCCGDEDLYNPDARWTNCNTETLLFLRDLFLFSLVIALVGWLGYITHVVHKDQRAIHQVSAPFNHIQQNIAAEVHESYYLTSREKGSGKELVDHLPMNIIIPKRGPSYESAYCRYISHSTTAEMWIQKQFELDLRNQTSKELVTKFESIQMRFEIPWGVLMDEKYFARKQNPPLPGAASNRPITPQHQDEDGFEAESNQQVTLINGIYYVYDTKKGTYVPQSNMNKEFELYTQKTPCPKPICSTYLKQSPKQYQTCYTGTGTGLEPYLNDISSSFVMIESTLHKLSLGFQSQNLNCVTEGASLTNPTCYCSTTTPPQMICSFDINPVAHSHGYYLLKVGFWYPALPQA